MRLSRLDWSSSDLPRGLRRAFPKLLDNHRQHEALPSGRRPAAFEAEESKQLLAGHGVEQVGGLHEADPSVEPRLVPKDPGQGAGGLVLASLRLAQELRDL